MLKKVLFLSVFLVILSGLVCFSGCESDAKTDALIGSLIGAGIGQAVGGDTEGTLIGAAAGGGIGYVVGSQSDKKKAQSNEVTSTDPSATADTVVNITNSNGSTIPVKLKRDGTRYIGPKGEIYESMPTEQQLRSVYGF